MSRENASIVIVFGILMALAWIAIARPDIIALGRRHGLPTIEAHLSGRTTPNDLAFVYWGDAEGIDLNDGHLNQEGGHSMGRTNGCEVQNRICVAEPSRAWEQLDTSTHQQGLSVYVPRHPGMRVGATLHWDAPSYPRKLTIACDFDEADLDRRCHVLSWEM